MSSYKFVYRENAELKTVSSCKFTINAERGIINASHYNIPINGLIELEKSFYLKDKYETVDMTSLIKNKLSYGSQYCKLSDLLKSEVLSILEPRKRKGYEKHYEIYKDCLVFKTKIGNQIRFLLMFDSKYKKFNNVFYIENNRNTLIKINSFSYDIESNFTETIVGNNLIKILDSNQYFESVTKRVWAA